MKNPFGKTVAKDQPYAVYQRGDWEWLVLKTYQLPKNEAKNSDALWFVAAKSDLNYGEFEMGDEYAANILRFGKLVQCTPEWKEHYLTNNCQ